MTVYEPIGNLHKMVLLKRKFFFVSVALFCFTLAFHLIYCNREMMLKSNLQLLVFKNKSFENDQINDSKETSGNSIIKQNGCRIPAMFLRGPLVQPYLEDVPLIYCAKRIVKSPDSNDTQERWESAIFEEKNNQLVIDKSSFKEYGSDLKCQYEEFFRAPPKENDSGNYNDGSVKFDKRTKKEIDLSKAVNISDTTEFVRVQCFKKESQSAPPIHKDYFAFVPLKKHVEERCEKIEKNQPTDGVSVMIIALDALSRLNFHRQMTLSSHYLKRQFDAIEMLGYNKVGDNTFPNFIPAFSGLFVEELKKKCWQKEDDYFDKCPFIWQKYQQRGYRTSFAEDSSEIAVFNYLKRGFREQPTDYYLCPFNLKAESEIGHNKPGNCNLCLGSRLNLSVMMNYALKFARRFHHKKFFGLFWSNSFTHDFFNLSPQGDYAVLTLLQNLYQYSLLNNTVLIFLSDHGLRWGRFRETFQGHLEERLPMLWFAFPKWFQNKYPLAVQNLRNNVDKLTTPFDFYETLNDFMNLTRIEDTEIKQRSQTNHGKGRQISLFLPVSANRTCSDAQIPNHFCACHNDVQTLNTTDAIIKKSAQTIVKQINHNMRNHPQCTPLKLKSIESASLERSQMSEKFDAISTPNEYESNYVITLKTTPGNAVFEATVRYAAAERKFLVIGSVSRINTYGSQGNCVNNYILRLYCYCKRSNPFI